MRTDGRTDLTKLIVAFCNYTNVSKKSYFIPQKHPLWPRSLDLQGGFDMPYTEIRDEPKSREEWIFTVDETGVSNVETPNKVLAKRRN